MSLLEALSVPHSPDRSAIVSPAVERAVGVGSAGAGWVVEADELGPLLREFASGRRSELRSRRSSAEALARRHDWDDVARRYETAYRRALTRSG
jgi:glycosyltransferase involved in cell wall biosynthesis